MPILGRAGESLAQRVFGNSGVGQGVKNVFANGGLGYIAARAAKGLATPGGFVGPSKNTSSRNVPFARPTQTQAPQQISVAPTPDAHQYSAPAGPDRGIQVLPNVGGAGSRGSASQYRQNQAALSSIGKGWNDANSTIKETSGALRNMGASISDLSKARDEYLTANDENLTAKRNAITGNRELIQRNQGNSLRDLADQVRKKIFSSNINLGASAGSSASEATARALSQAASKDRSGILTQYGDQISEQNQNEGNAVDAHKMQRDKAYEWEAQQKKAAIEEFNQTKQVLDRIKKMVPEWKRADLEEESNARLKDLLSNLGQIGAQAKSYRDSIHSLRDSMHSQAQGVRESNIGIDAPAELDTPQFNDQLDLTDLQGEDPNATDFYNPNVKFKKRQSSDILNNPLIFE